MGPREIERLLQRRRDVAGSLHVQALDENDRGRERNHARLEGADFPPIEDFGDVCNDGRQWRLVFTKDAAGLGARRVGKLAEASRACAANFRKSTDGKVQDRVSVESSRTNYSSGVTRRGARP